MHHLVEPAVQSHVDSLPPPVAGGERVKEQADAFAEVARTKLAILDSMQCFMELPMNPTKILIFELVVRPCSSLRLALQ
jgi:hypothetical protein